MANIKISEMTEATSFENGDYAMIVQANQNKKISYNAIVTLINQTINKYNKQRYYIGSIIIDTQNINPNVYLGFGKWQYFGKGRTLVGVNVSDEDFLNPELVGGEKTHTLTVEEMPSHSHFVNRDIRKNATSFSDSNSLGSVTGGTIKDTVITTSNTGGGQAHNNMPPYITVYFWKRVA